MRPNLFPQDFIEHTTEYHVSRQSSNIQIIYVALLLTLLIGIALLPFIMVDVTVKSLGLLRATTEVSIIKATVNCIVKEVAIKENENVEKGQVLFYLASPKLQEEESHLKNELQETNFFLEDVTDLLLSVSSDQFPVTNFYTQSLSGYQQKLADRKTRLAKVNQDYERNKKLFDQKVIAAADFENFEFKYNKAKSEIELLKQNQLSQWQQERRNYEKEITELQNQLAQVQKETEQLQIKAPVRGTVQNLSGIYVGSTVFAGQELAQISPNTGLQAEVYVSPNDIGLLREGMDVRMQIGAFNYNQWGLLHGKVKEISSDIQVANNQPLFEVKCTLDKDHLTLKNGYEGKLKKGMTLQARFVVTQRSLWQLLYDKVDDWVNPNVGNSH